MTKAKAPPKSERPLTIGPVEGPEPPFPLRFRGPIIKGFGRGSKEVRSQFFLGRLGLLLLVLGEEAGLFFHQSSWTRRDR
jgi:hypothetical protein